jgi:sugar phosphate isomerase/epimerase
VGADISFLSVSVDALDGGPAEQIGLALDTDHLNIEERDPAAATCRAAPPTQPCAPAQLVGLTLPP